MRRLVILCIVACVIFTFFVVHSEMHDEKCDTWSKDCAMRKLAEMQWKSKIALHDLHVTCIECKLFVDVAREMVEQNSTVADMAHFITVFCQTVALEQPYVCRQMVSEFQDEGIFFLTHAVLTSHEICGMFLNNCGESEPPRRFVWNITIPGNKPPVQPWPQLTDGSAGYKVLHLSDIHIDRQYAIGSEAYCQLDSPTGTYFMCCRNYPDEDLEGHAANVPRLAKNQEKDKIVVPAGPWGMPYACDIPYQTFESALKQISQNHKDVDYVMVTGDYQAHDMWDYTRGLTTTNIENMTQAFLKYFPNTPIYFSIGNHEGVPQDAIAPHNMPEYETRGPQWLYSLLSQMWSNWVPPQALPAIQYRGSYAVRPKKGLKLISLNTIYCSEFNFYLYIDEVDPDATLEWLIEELVDSESLEEKVHIISHIPPGLNYCLEGWSTNYFKIVERFENTIAQQFFGHTHNDHFQVYYDMEDPQRRPFHFNWITPSLTTMSFNNPAYRIYEIDNGGSFVAKNAYTYTADVLEANKLNKEPEFKLLYDTKAFYGMKDLSPQSWSDLSDQLWANTTMFRQFVKHYYRNDYDNECYTSKKCRFGYICPLKTARSYDKSFCDKLE